MVFQLKIEFKEQRHHKYRCHRHQKRLSRRYQQNVMVGEAQPHAQRLVDITQECLYQRVLNKLLPS